MDNIVHRVTVGLTSDKSKAIAIHDYVRDQVKFGFNAWWDTSPPETTIQQGVGHCNPKGCLFVAMLKAAGIQAHQHAVTIPNTLLYGVLSNAPPILTHTFTEVELDGRTINVDSYIVDAPLWAVAQERLKLEGRVAGYGVHSKGTCTWDGAQDAFAQFADRADMVADLGRVDSVQQLVALPGFTHSVGFLGLHTVLAPVRVLAPGWFARQVNRPLEVLRQGQLAS